MAKGPARRKSALPQPDPADWETIPLDFELPPSGTTVDDGGRTRTPVAYARCPHHKSERKTGLQRTDRHLVYRLHWIVTWAGAKLPCPASGAALCVAPDAARLQHCDCERVRTWT
jgi:hypothetical protein